MCRDSEMPFRPRKTQRRIVCARCRAMALGNVAISYKGKKGKHTIELIGAKVDCSVSGPRFQFGTSAAVITR